MRIQIEDLEVLFPYDYVYPEQLQYMTYLKRSLHSGHCVLEMPTGTGKTVALLSLILAFQHQNGDAGKLIYCTRTVQEMDKVVEELKRVMDYRHRELQAQAAAAGGAQNRGHQILGLCLSSRRNLCIHPTVSRLDNRDKVDSLCRQMTASFVREGAQQAADIELCDFYEQFAAEGVEHEVLSGVHSLADLKRMGRDKGWCPYFMARHVVSYANVIVYNYQYLLDPRIAEMVSSEIDSRSIVVFDEAHNIDNICIEALSVTLNKRTLQLSSRNVATLKNRVLGMERTNRQRLEAEYQQLVRGMAGPGSLSASDLADDIASNSVLSPAMIDEVMPGNIRQARHFVQFLATLLEYLKQYLERGEVHTRTPGEFVRRLAEELNMQPGVAMKYSYTRLNSLMRTLEVADIEEFAPLQTVTNFAALVANYDEGFMVIYEPYDEREPDIADPKLQLCCLDASIAIKPVFQRFTSVIITSGTLSPLDMYPKLLECRPAVMESLPMTMARNSICPMIVTKGNDQLPMSSKYDVRSTPGVVQNYGNLLIELCKVVPDGIVCFFTGYGWMEEVVTAWAETKVLQEILQHKLVFIETRDVVETSTALDNYRTACDRGRGAVFLSVARGKVAEGIDFDGHYGRAVLMIGLPVQYTLSRTLQARLEFMHRKYRIRDNDFLTFDAIRQASQCLGRVIRSKSDYGLMVFADHRFNRLDKRRKLPQWIQQWMAPDSLSLSIDSAVSMARGFLKEMAQSRSKSDDLGFTMLSEADLEERRRKEEQAAQQQLSGQARVQQLQQQQEQAQKQQQLQQAAASVSARPSEQEMREAMRANQHRSVPFDADEEAAMMELDE